ncbi:MAG: sugar phosphate isomerase/epimerase [Armatimonadaceae bacterium]
MARIPIAVQLYSVRKEAEQDLAGVLAEIARMGYEGVEFAGYYGHDAATIKKLLDDNGLKCAGTHIGLKTLLDEELPATVEFNQTIGNKYLIVPGLAEEYRNSTEAVRDTATRFNEIAAKVRPHGMQVGYHNHAFEFKPFTEGGELPWDTFFGNMEKDVIMQFDIGNALHAGADALPFLQQYPGRATTVHLKEFSATNDKALVGEGDVPWQAIFAEVEKQGATDWYIVEQESYAFPPMECIEKCLQNLKEMGK